jgi:hypothetical protein
MSSELGRKPVGDRMPLANWEVVDLAARDAIAEARPGVALAATDIGRCCRVGAAAPYAYYLLERVSPSLSWSADLASGGGASDHGALSGLGDNDHPQYALATDVNTALAGKADASALTSGLASKASLSVEKGFRGSREVNGSASADQEDDAGGAIDITAAGPTNQIVPRNSTRAHPVNGVLTWFNNGNGVPTITPEDGTVILIPSPGKSLAMKSGEGACAQARQRSANRWYVYGDLEDA